MKKKLLFSAVALATVLAGCSQDEWIENDNLQVIGDRPMVEAPTITFAGAETRLTADNNLIVSWENGDGFGAALMDSYDAEKADWAEKFDIQKYISSNILFETNDNGASFGAKASLAWGNYLFYAPFNADNYKREALKVQIPTTQVVVPTGTAAPSVSAWVDFYEDGKNPVYVAYDSIWNSPKTKLELKLSHLYAQPMITLVLGDNVQSLDTDGNLKTQDNPESDDPTDVIPVYEETLTIDSIAFVSKILVQGAIDNDKFVAQMNKGIVSGVKQKSAWEKAQYTNAKTTDLLVTVNEETDKKVIGVKFEPALTISKTEGGKFVLVFPADDFIKEDMEIELYTTINGESHVAVMNGQNTKKEFQPAQAMTLLPGQFYAAAELSAEGKPKDSKGTSATYTIEDCQFKPVEVATPADPNGYKEIESYAALETFVKSAKYRGVDFFEITKEMAVAHNTAYDAMPDNGLFFVVTAEEPIELDAAFLATFNENCVLGDKGSITFLSGDDAGNAKVVLGDINYDVENTTIKFASYTGFDGENSIATTTAKPAYVVGDATISGVSAEAANVLTFNVLSGASVTFDKDLAYTASEDRKELVVNNNGGTIYFNTTGASQININNNIGTLNVLATPATDVAIENGIDTDYDDEDEIDYYAEMNIAVATGAGTINNNTFGKIAADGDVDLTFASNTGLITVGNKRTTLVVTANDNGQVDNTNNGLVTAGDGKGTIFATLGAMTNAAAAELAYDDASGINTFVLTGEWSIDSATAFEALFTKDTGKFKAVKTLNFAAGSSLYLESGVTVIDLTKTVITKINVVAEGITWGARSESKINTGDGVVTITGQPELDNVEIVETLE